MIDGNSFHSRYEYLTRREIHDETAAECSAGSLRYIGCFSVIGSIDHFKTLHYCIASSNSVARSVLVAYCILLVRLLEIHRRLLDASLPTSL